MIRRALVGAVVAVLSAFCQTPNSQPTPVFGTTVVLPTGLEGDIYFVRRHDGGMPNFNKKKHIKATVYTTRLDVPPQDFKQGFPGVADRLEWFAIDYHGKFYVSVPGDYRWQLTSDDGSELYIDGRRIIDDGGIHPPETRGGTACLATGIHEIRVLYLQGPKFLVALVLQVAPPGQNLHIFDTNAFKPPQEDPLRWPKPNRGPCGQ